MSKVRIVELQKSLRIARTALERIQCRHRNPEGLATQALDEMWKLEPKQQIQGVVGHAVPRPSLVDQGRPACGQGDELGHKPTDEGYSLPRPTQNSEAK